MGGPPCVPYHELHVVNAFDSQRSRLRHVPYRLPIARRVNTARDNAGEGEEV